MNFFNLGESLFKKEVEIPDNADIVWVADAFAEDYPGGAELTSEALIESCQLNVFKIHSKDVTLKLLQQGFQKYWIFGNFSALDKGLIPSIVANLRYSIIEFDYKYCRYRSPEKHFHAEKSECNCNNEQSGMLVSAFMHGAVSLWWMSEKQQAHYHKLFPFLREKTANTVLSSVFDDSFFAKVKLLREKYANVEKKGWLFVGSPSWIKGASEAKAWCELNNLEYEAIWGDSYEKTLERLAQAEGFVCLPPGGDTCPRMVIEAKLLGCKLHLNENVQHKDEIWFNTDDLLDTESYLYLSRERFWNGIKADMNYRPTISGYTTTKDCITQDYPYKECITSMLGFCDEVVVVDGGSTDGTWEELCELAANDERIIIHQQKRDWTATRFAVFDGQQKALARSLCTKDFCWQMDSDEVVHEKDYERIKDFVRYFPKNVPLFTLPVIEYWGGKDKVRMDINVWKWRISRNFPQITHGVPAQLRKYDSEGNLFSAPGSDGCDYIRSDNYQPVPSIQFYTNEIEQLRQSAFHDPVAKDKFKSWFENAITSLPPVYHFSWFNIPRKIRTYKNYWSRHWESLYDIKQEDTVENNKFFDKKWADVTEDDIQGLAKKLKTEMGGWIFHRKVDFSKKTPHLEISNEPPAIMKDWIKRNEEDAD